ncbi:unnamed protein product [Arctia plantaginis]|uniref:Uncharacterized protein n=1 Tax=Arctia plantaginis TaxID=874455 RepID=A0A8S0ZX61_ARCPL|nr:unnamed protein product [Arctia plantaginis]
MQHSKESNTHPKLYGQSVPDEEIAYYYNGDIPDLTPIYTHKIDEKELKPHLEKNFTFLKVEYLSPVSTVYIEYFPATYTLKFTIVVPLVSIKFAVAAFALKKKSRRQSRSSLNVVYLKI